MAGRLGAYVIEGGETSCRTAGPGCDPPFEKCEQRMTVRLNVRAYLGVLGWDLDLLWVADGRGFGDPPRRGGLQRRLRSTSVNRARDHNAKVYELVVVQALV